MLLVILTAVMGLACSWRNPSDRAAGGWPWLPRWVKGAVGTPGLVHGRLRVLNAPATQQSLGLAVVYLEGRAASTGGPLDDELTLVFGSDGRIEPAVIAASPGQRVRVAFEGGVLHQPFTYSLGRDDDALLPEADAAGINVERPGVIRIYCSLHGGERAVIFVSESPYHAVVNSDGGYEIQDVPAGSYRLVLWSEAISGPIRSIEVESGASLESPIWIDARKMPQ